jgi:hypothetical protein
MSNTLNNIKKSIVCVGSVCCLPFLTRLKQLAFLFSEVLGFKMELIAFSAIVVIFITGVVLFIEMVKSL